MCSKNVNPGRIGLTDKVFRKRFGPVAVLCTRCYFPANYPRYFFFMKSSLLLLLSGLSLFSISAQAQKRKNAAQALSHPGL